MGQQLVCRGGASQDHRARILGEIVSSEQKYLRNLRTLEHVYKIPMEKRLKKLGGVTTDDVKMMFGNLSSIIDLHELICRDFEDNLQQAPETLQKYSKFFLLYIQYSNGYMEATQKVETLRMGKRFRTFLEDQKEGRGTVPAAPNMQVQDISSYLIMPIQRVPRYELLLRELLSKTPDTHMQKPQIESALQAIKESAKQLNEMKRQCESAATLAEYYHSMKGAPKDFSLLRAGRCFLSFTPAFFMAEGSSSPSSSFSMSSGRRKKWVEGYLLLCNDLAVLLDTGYSYLWHCMLEHAHFSEVVHNAEKIKFSSSNPSLTSSDTSRPFVMRIVAGEKENPKKKRRNWPWRSRKKKNPEEKGEKDQDSLQHRRVSWLASTAADHKTGVALLKQVHEATALLVQNQQSMLSAQRSGGSGFDPGSGKKEEARGSILAGLAGWASSLGWKVERDPFLTILDNFRATRRPPRVVAAGRTALDGIGVYREFVAGDAVAPINGEELVIHIPNTDALIFALHNRRTSPRTTTQQAQTQAQQQRQLQQHQEGDESSSANEKRKRGEDGLRDCVLVTNRRVLELKEGKVRLEIPLDHVQSAMHSSKDSADEHDEVSVKVHTGVKFRVSVWHKQAAEYLTACLQFIAGELQKEAAAVNKGTTAAR